MGRIWRRLCRGCRKRKDIDEFGTNRRGLPRQKCLACCDGKVQF